MATGLAQSAAGATSRVLRPDAQSADVYGLIAGGRTVTLPRATQIAESIVDELAARGWPVGEVVGSERGLAARYRVGTNVIRQSLRLLEARGVGWIRPGPSGGLIVGETSRGQLVEALARNLRWSGLASADIREAKELIDAYGRDPALSEAADGMPSNPALSLILDTLHEFDLEGLRAPASKAPLRQRAKQAIEVATALMKEISPERCTGGHYLGSASSLSEQYGVDPLVFAQAVRLMTDLGIARVQRGRNGGLFLRAPDGAAIVRFVHAQMAAQRLNPKDAHRSVWCLNIIHARKAAERGSANPSLADAEEQLASAPPDLFHYAWIRLQREIAYSADVPALHMFARCFAAFDIRGAIDCPPPSAREVREIRLASCETARAIRARSPDRAEQAQSLCQALIDERLSRFPALDTVH